MGIRGLVLKSSKTSGKRMNKAKTQKKRDVSALRKQIILEILQHPLTSFPFAMACISAAWAGLVNPTPPAIIGAIAGTGIALLGGIWTLMFRGPVIRDAILHKWEKEAQREEDLTHQELRESLVKAGGSDDIVQLFDEIEGLYDDALHALDHEEISTTMKAHFLPIIEENHNSAIAIFNKLAFTQQRLTNLLASIENNNTKHSHRIRKMRENRLKMVSHLRRLSDVLEKIPTEIPKVGDSEIDLAEEKLSTLENSLEMARRAREQVEEELRSPSGAYKLHGLMREKPDNE